MTVGLDLERVRDGKSTLWPLVFSEVGLLQLEETGPRARDTMATVLFVAKEAFHKVLWSMIRERRDFLDVEIKLKGVTFDVFA